MADLWTPSCAEPLPADLYPEGCNAQAQVCGLLRGHDGEHRAWVQMGPVVVDWPATDRADTSASRSDFGSNEDRS